MVDVVPQPEAPQEPRAEWPHEWLLYETYVTVYTSYMDGLQNEGLVLDNGLSFNHITGDDKELLQVEIAGEIVCASEVILDVEKTLDARRNERRHIEVQGRSYSYAARSTRTGHPILRYDCHGWGGVEQLHKHLYNPSTGIEIGKRPISLDDLPPLDKVIREAVERAP